MSIINNCQKKVSKKLTLEGDAEMGEVPDAHVLLVEDLVLPIVGDEVVFDKFVVDHGGFNGLGIPLDLRFEL
jgi:hypothetical protein